MDGPIYTKKGDKGKTSLLTGDRVEKFDPRVEAYGTVDELNSCLGIVKAFAKDECVHLPDKIQAVQERLFSLASEIATPLDAFGENNALTSVIKRITPDDSVMLEKLIDELTEKLPPLRNFVIPGGTKTAAFLHQARTVCRRAERRLVSFSRTENINPETIKFLNRLSDLLFTMARHANIEEGDGDFLISREGVDKQAK
ncbi:MAG: cob(I)yrinic acid a,c-diamide adenosyltransferase [Candidatus Odinarchaeota archaeon]